MKRYQSTRFCTALFVGLGTAGVLLLCGRSVWADGPSDTPTITVRAVEANDNPPSSDAKIAASKYWLGLQCEPASEAVRVQLELPKDQGLVVLRVLQGGPADKAEIKPNDLLLTAGDKKLTAVADLAAAVETAKEESFKLKLLRGGKPIEVSVRPALRPENPQANPMQPGDDREMVERWLKQFGMNAPGAGGNGITFVHPGAGLVLPPGVTIRPELPDDMSVDIHREGKKPAEITVKKGKDTWKATEDDLSKLPEDVRHEVEPLLHGGPVRFWFRELRSSAAPAADPAAAAGRAANSDGEVAPPNPADAQRQQSSARELDELNRRLDEMRQSLQELRQRDQSQQRDGPSSDHPDR